MFLTVRGALQNPDAERGQRFVRMMHRRWELDKFAGKVVRSFLAVNDHVGKAGAAHSVPECTASGPTDESNEELS
jgi:hypothetical protein